MKLPATQPQRTQHHRQVLNMSQHAVQEQPQHVRQAAPTPEELERYALLRWEVGTAAANEYIQICVM